MDHQYPRRDLSAGALATDHQRHPIRLIASVAVALMTVFALASAPYVAGQSVEDISGAPVDVHSGTCEEPVLEPIFDAGELGSDTITGIQDEKDPTEGMITDEEAGARGVDLNGDGALDENEIVGGIDSDAPVAWADADFSEFDEAIDDEDFQDQLVVIVHADADDGYSTFVACGSITDTEANDDGRRIIPLAPQGDSTHFGYAVLSDDGGSMDTYMFQPGDASSATPDPLAGAEGTHPIDLHSGTCTDWTTEPIEDLGEMHVTNVAAEGEQEAGDTSGDVPETALELGPVYVVETVDETELDVGQLINDGPHVIAVHQSAEEYETLVACGPILDFTQNGTLLVPLKPVGDSNLTGVAMIGAGGLVEDVGDTVGVDGVGAAGFNAFLWQTDPIESSGDTSSTDEAGSTPEATPEG